MAERLLAQQERECNNCPECIICLYKLTLNPPVVALYPCGHVFHQRCILKVRQFNRNPFLEMYEKYDYEKPDRWKIEGLGICPNCRV